MHDADQSLTRNDGQDVFDLVIDSLTYLTLQNGKPYSEEEKNEIRADKEISEKTLLHA